MTNTNLPPQPNDDLLREISNQLSESNQSLSLSQRLTKSNTRSLSNLKDSFTSFATPLTRLRSSLQRMDQTNRKLTQMGTTYDKFTVSLDKNSKVLNQSNVSNRALVGELAKNYEQGIRINNGALTDLTKEMIATGQNTALQRTMNANAILQTGNNTEAVQQINKTNREVSDKYGITNDRLIESLNSLKDTVDSVSLFGPQAVTAFSNITQKIQGRVGGADVTAATQTVLKILTPGVEKLSASLLLGAGDSRGRTSAGGAPTMEDVEALLKKIKDISDSTGGQFKAEIAASKAGLSKQEFVQLKNMYSLMESDFKLNKEVQVTEKEKYNNLKNLQDKQNDWYDYGAKVMLTMLGTMNTSLITLAMKLPLAAGLGGSANQILRTPTPTRPTRSPNSAMGMAAAAAAGGSLMAGGSRGIQGSTQPIKPSSVITPPVRHPATGTPLPLFIRAPARLAHLQAERAARIDARATARATARSTAWQQSGGADRTRRNQRLGMLGYDPISAPPTASERRDQRRAARPGWGGRMQRMKGGLKNSYKSPMAGMGVGLGAGLIGEATGVDMTSTATGAMMGSMIAPGIGTAIGTGVGLVVDLVKYSRISSEAAQERVKQEKEKRDEERADAISRDERRLNWMVGMLRSRSIEDPVDASQWEALLSDTNRMAKNTERTPGSGISALRGTK